MAEYLMHHGRKGQQWGVENGPPYPLGVSSAKYEKLQKKDAKWVSKHENKIKSKAFNAAKKEIKSQQKELDRQYQAKTGKGAETWKHYASYATDYNKIVANAMNKHVNTLTTHTKQSVMFVAKRGELGVHTAMTYNKKEVESFNKSGVYSSGRQAYRKTGASVVEVKRKKNGGR